MLVKNKSFESTFPTKGNFQEIVDFLLLFKTTGLVDTKLTKMYVDKQRTFDEKKVTQILQRSEWDKIRRKLTKLKNACIAMGFLKEGKITELGNKLIETRNPDVFLKGLENIATYHAARELLKQKSSVSFSEILKTITSTIKNYFRDVSINTIILHARWLIEQMKFLRIVYTDERKRIYSLLRQKSVLEFFNK